MITATWTQDSPIELPPRSAIWPPRDRFGLARLELAATADGTVRTLVDQLMATADALAALQRGGMQSADLEGELLNAGSATMRQLGEVLGGDLGQALGQRADAIAARDWDTNARLTARCPDHRAVVLYGPLHTWSMKGDDYGFSGAVAVRDDAADDLVRRVEGKIVGARDEVGMACAGQPLDLDEVPAYVVADLVACAGEADTFPKHFAYFMPEDGRVPDLVDTMTVVFRNVYVAQFDAISARIADAVMPSWKTLAPDVTERALLTWFRGHDVAHFMGLGGPPPTEHLSEWRGFLRGSLQETYADVVGYLLASTPAVLAEAGLDEAQLAQVFVAEMLRYFRRGWDWFPDSCAAQVELAYLIEGGWLDLEDLDPAGLRKGMQALATELVAALLRKDEATKARLRTYCSSATRPAWLLPFERVLRDATRHVPDGLYYTLLS